METLLWWLEPAERHARAGRSKVFDILTACGFGALAGLVVAMLSGPTRELALSAQTSVSVPAHGWQYALGLGVAVVGGWLFHWGTAYRPEVSMRTDGIQCIVGKATFQFYPDAQMQSCELARVEGASYLLLRITMKPERPGDAAPPARELAIPERIDTKRVREILRTAGVSVSGPDGI
jgi:hypothetical protein